MRDRTSSLAALGTMGIRLGLAAGSLLLLASSQLYPGGTYFGTADPGSFWLNFLCDWTADVAVNGVPNPGGSACAKGALAAFGVALACFWLLLPRALEWRGKGATACRLLGLTSLGGLALAPFTSDVAHIVAVLGSCVPALAAGILGFAASWKRREDRLMAGVAGLTLLAALADAVLYVRSYVYVPRVVPFALPALQKVALLGVLVWMALVARALTRGRRAALAIDSCLP